MMHAAEEEYIDERDQLDAAEQAKADQESKLNALAQVLAKQRSEAIGGRESCGIEKSWLDDEDFYDGIDGANRNEVNSWRSKPPATGSTFDNSNSVRPTGSTVFPNITRPYVDAGSARTADMLLPTDDVSWRFDPTPVPEMIGIADGNFPTDVQRQIQAEGGDAEATMSKIAAAVKADLEEARAKATKAEKQIQDWHVECQYHAQVRSVIEDAARIGHGVLKGPVPVSKRRVAYKGGKLIIQDDLKPASFRLDPWNFYPDPGCGQDIQNGSYAMDRDDITHRKLLELKRFPGYFPDQIDACIKEGPHQACKIEPNNDGSGLVRRDTTSLYEIWYFYSQISVQDYLNALQVRMWSEGEDPEELQREADSLAGETVYIQATMVNNRIIRLVQNHLDTGEFPYDVMVWQRLRGLPYGVGIAGQMRTSQRIVIAGWRNMMDNAGRAAGPQVLVNDEYVQPENGVYEFVPFKIWRLIKTLDPNVRLDQVFGFVKIDMMQGELASIIEMGMRMAEDSTGLPMIMQGQTNSATPDTVGGMQLQENNAGTVLRRIARLFDDLVTERHVRRYYTYLLQYSDDDSMKGDFTINAMGSSALVERALQSQNIIQIGSMAANPMYGIDPKKWAAEFLKSLRLDATRFEFDDGEWEEIVAGLSQPQSNPAVEIAQMREQGATERQAALLASKENVAAFEVQAERELAESKQAFLLQLEQLSQDVKAYEEGMTNGRLDKTLKVKLAEVAAKLRAQLVISGSGNGSSQVLTPPTEPPGRAPDGQAFAR